MGFKEVKVGETVHFEANKIPAELIVEMEYGGQFGEIYEITIGNVKRENLVATFMPTRFDINNASVTIKHHKSVPEPNMRDIPPYIPRLALWWRN
jgi:hypothetical protein